VDSFHADGNVSSTQTTFIRAVTMHFCRFIVVVSLLVPAVVEAQGSTPRDEALVLFRRAVVHFERGELDVAEGLLRSAYDAFPEPVLLFNLALALERLERPEEALETYTRYVDRHPNAADVDEARRRIDTIHVALDVAQREATERERPDGTRAEATDASTDSHTDSDVATEVGPAATTDEPRSSRSSAERASLTGPASLLGGGLVVVAAGVGAGAMSRTAAARARDEDASQVDASREYERAERRARAANVGLSIGGALVVASVAWLAVRIKRRRADTLSLSVGAGSLSLRGSW
jgi:tetratricopeptide (TPR) repeat protein